MLEFSVLGSGSSGNATVVCLGKTRILVDAGLSARQIKVRLEEIGIDPDSISAIILTHEHTDHAQGLDVFCRKRNMPVYATPHTCHVVQEKWIKKAEIHWHQFEAGSRFQIGDIEIESFNVPHDAVDPVGFVLRGAGASLGVLTDVGSVTRLIVERLRGLDALFVESNYDDMMLQNDMRRPWSLKQRIGNRHGHLSNEQTGELLIELAQPNLQHVVLGHLSSDCNTAEIAIESATSALAKTECGAVTVVCAERKKPLPLKRIIVATPEPVQALISENHDVEAADEPSVIENTTVIEPPTEDVSAKPVQKKEEVASKVVYEQTEWGF